MRIRCPNCSESLAVEPRQLGGSIVCQHCGRQVALPAASAAPGSTGPDGDLEPPRRWLDNSISGLASVVFHAVLLIVMALISYGREGTPGLGEEVSIGTLPEVSLDDSPVELDSSASEPEASDSSLELTELELAAPTSLTDAGEEVSIGELSPTGAGPAGGGEFDLGAIGRGGALAGGGSWEGLLQNLRRNGLDIVIAFDSTSSMSGEIDQVKSQIERIGKSLLKLIPKARVSLCTYRDRGDVYVVRGMPLTNDVAAMRSFLYGVSAGGGGDTPEAVEEGLRWALSNNSFRSQARKVILVFGDAPPHGERLAECLELASDFNRQQQGIVSTVTCRGGVLRSFREIATAGGGEAFLTTDERQIMTQLVVLVFGAKHRAKVLEAFDLLGG